MRSGPALRICPRPASSPLHPRARRKPTTRQMAQLAELLSLHPNDEPTALDHLIGSLQVIRGLVEDWGDRMLASGDAKRWQTAIIAVLASRAPFADLLSVLTRLLDDNLRRFRRFRMEAHAAGWRPSETVNEARRPCTGEYQRAFLAIEAPETAALMQGYLGDEHFGVLAAKYCPSNGGPK